MEDVTLERNRRLSHGGDDLVLVRVDLAIVTLQRETDPRILVDELDLGAGTFPHLRLGQNLVTNEVLEADDEAEEHEVAQEAVPLQMVSHLFVLLLVLEISWPASSRS